MDWEKMLALGYGLPAAERREVVATLEHLRSIVATLPKCWRMNDAGDVVQDCPVVPGMPVWLVGTKWICHGEVGFVGEDGTVLVNDNVLWPDVDTVGNWSWRSSNTLANSPEAAEVLAARKETD